MPSSSTPGTSSAAMHPHVLQGQQLPQHTPPPAFPHPVKNSCQFAEYHLHPPDHVLCCQLHVSTAARC
jgi:hypothetical protein